MSKAMQKALIGTMKRLSQYGLENEIQIDTPLLTCQRNSVVRGEVTPDNSVAGALRKPLMKESEAFWYFTK
jgi:hypothetical protein